MLFNTQAIQPIEVKPVLAIIRPAEEKPKAKAEVIYTIKQGDTLTSIAEAHNVPLNRLWAKNGDLADPDKIEPGKPLKVPENGETLPDRPMPETIVAVDLSPTQTSAPSGRSSVSKPYSTHVENGTNTYTPGYCTWYAKNMRPDLPNNLGNADTWYIRYTGAKGSAPAVGAIGVTKAYMHVVYITGVNGDGTVTVSEMNYKGLYVISSRTAPASEFNYIY